jgi:hypothetical protein
MYRTSLVFATLVFIGSCSERTNLSTTEYDKIKREIEAALHKNFETIAAEGWIGELKALDDSRQFSWVPPGKYAPINYDSMKSVLQRATMTIEKTELAWIELYVKPISQTLATYSGRYSSRYTMKSGKVAEFTMAESGTVIRKKNGWKLISGQTFLIR